MKWERYVLLRRLDNWVMQFAANHPVGIWILAVIWGMICFLPLAALVNWLSK